MALKRVRRGKKEEKKRREEENKKRRRGLISCAKREQEENKGTREQKKNQNQCGKTFNSLFFPKERVTNSGETMKVLSFDKALQIKYFSGVRLAKGQSWR